MDKKRVLKIDIARAIEEYNKRNPNLRQMNMTRLGEIVLPHISKAAAAAAISNWNRGVQRPVLRFEHVLKIADALGIPYTNLYTEQHGARNRKGHG